MVKELISYNDMSPFPHLLLSLQSGCKGITIIPNTQQLYVFQVFLCFYRRLTSSSRSSNSLSI